MVAKAVVPHFAVEFEIKYAPLMVNVKAGPPAVASPGLSPLMAGGAWLMVKVAGAGVPALLATVMLPVPENSIRLAGTETLNYVGPM